MSAHDADYLKATVGPALVQAMTSMVVTQPPDAVDYLGNYLLAYVEREEGKAKQAARFKELDVAVAELNQKEAEAAAAEAARLEALKPGAEELALKEELATSTEIAPLYARVLEFAKAQTGATAVYIGKKEPGEGDVPVISFLAATDGCDMEGKSLKGKPEGDEEAAVEGVTFGLFDKRTDLPEEEEAPAEPEEGAVAEAKPKIDPYPTELFVSNVIREGNMKFFGIPMLGSYLTVPVKFSHLLHAEGVLELTEEEIKAEADAKAAAAAALEAAALEAGEEPPAPVEPDPEEEARPQVKQNPLPGTLCLCMHTMGQAREFTESEKAKAKEWAGVLSAALQTAENKLWDGHVTSMADRASNEKVAADDVAQETTTQQAKKDGAVAALEEAEGSPERALKEKQIALTSTVEILTHIKESVSGLGQLRLAPKPEAIKLLHAAFLLVGTAPEAFLGFATKKVEWEKMRELISETLVKAIETCDPAAEGALTPKLIATCTEMTAELTVEVLQPLGIAYVVILNWLKAAMETFEAAEAKRVADEEAKKAAAAEAAAA